MWAISGNVLLCEPTTCDLRALPKYRYCWESERHTWFIVHDDLLEVIGYNTMGDMLPRLKAPKLEFAIQKVLDMGLANTDSIRRALIPPLSLSDNLPEEAFVDWYYENLCEQERALSWHSVFNGYKKLNTLARIRGRQDRFLLRVAAVLIEFLIRVTRQPAPEPLANPDPRLDTGVKDLLKACFRHKEGILYKAILLLRRVYEKQSRKEEFEGAVGKIEGKEEFRDAILNMERFRTNPSSMNIKTRLPTEFVFRNDTDVLGWTEESYKCLRSHAGRNLDYKMENTTDVSGQTILHHFAAGGIYEPGFAINKVRSWKAQTTNGQLPLHYAAVCGDWGTIRRLLQKGADVNAVDFVRRSALFFAAWHEKADAVGQLLAEGADVDKQDKWGATAIHVAAFHGYLEVVQQLLENSGTSINLHDNRKRTALSYAAEKGHLGIVMELLKQEVEPDSGDDRKRTPLSYAAKNGHFKVVQALLGMGDKVKVNRKDRFGQSLLSCVSEKKHPEIVDLLQKTIAERGRSADNA